jgi:hypothetical protein
MPTWLINLLITALTLVVTLTITFLFNKLVAFPKEIKKQKAAEAKAIKEKEEADRLWKETHEQKDAAWKAQHDQADANLLNRITNLEAAVNALPAYKAQSLQIQTQLQAADKEILDALVDIKSGIKENQDILNSRLDRLEDREKNAIRAKLLDEYRLFTDEHKNPMLAWSEMEHHAFFKLVRDYEDLHGNDYVHEEVLPAMNRLNVIKMSDRQALLELMNSRRL